MNKLNKKTIILIVCVLIFCLVVGISVGRYLFKVTHPNVNMTSNCTYYV